MSTRSAVKAQTLRACFYISANLIADAGSKKISVQYIAPDSTILSGSDTILNNELVMYSTTTSVEYKNQQLFVCIDWQRFIPLKEGDYLVKIFIDDLFTAESQFKLR